MSWVIVSRATGLAVMETYTPGLADRVNLERYEVLETEQYLQRVNAEIAAGSTKYNTQV